MPLSVSTNCPSCGGSIEFEEGSNAVHCRYCGSNHVVTGRGRVLSYYVPEKISMRMAAALALQKLKEADGPGWKAREVTLFFVPFYRFVGQALQWEVEDKVIAGGDEREAPKGILNVHINVRFGGMGGPDMRDILSGGSEAARLTERRFELSGQYIDRSMPALDAPELGVSSLGLRPEILKLSLFERGAVAARGQIAPVEISVKDKEEQGYRHSGDGEIASRGVFGKTASVIYNPFWVIEVTRGDETAFSVVDGVSGEVTSRKATAKLLDALVDKDGQRFDVAGFRPLKCPNCAGELPVKPKDVVFFCNSCRKAWYISGDELVDTPYTVVASAKKGAGTPEYFPFWVVRARMRSGDNVIDTKYDIGKMAPGLMWPKDTDKEIPFRFFVPAFRVGSLKVVSRLASGFTKNQPVLKADQPLSFAVRGCYLSPEDALIMAPLILFSLVPKGNTHALKFAADSKVEVMGGELVLLPFYKAGYDFTDGLYGWSFPVASLRD